MKLFWNAFCVSLFFAVIGLGTYGLSFSGTTTECNCIYPNSGEYGVKVPANPENTATSCEVTSCWVSIDGEGGVPIKVE